MSVGKHTLIRVLNATKIFGKCRGKIKYYLLVTLVSRKIKYFIIYVRQVGITRIPLCKIVVNEKYYSQKFYVFLFLLRRWSTIGIEMSGIWFFDKSIHRWNECPYIQRQPKALPMATLISRAIYRPSFAGFVFVFFLKVRHVCQRKLKEKIYFTQIERKNWISWRA